MSHTPQMSPSEVIRELKGLKLNQKDLLMSVQSERAKEMLDAEERANLAVLYHRRVTALKYMIHWAEEAQVRRHARAA